MHVFARGPSSTFGGVLVKSLPTLKGLMVVIAVIGVGIGALIRPNKFWCWSCPFSS